MRDLRRHQRPTRFAGAPISHKPLLIALLLAGLAWLANSTPAAAAEGQRPRLADIPARMQQFVDQGQISGAVTVVGRHDRVLSCEAVGLRDLQTREPMTKDTLFRIASMTKPITAVGIMILVDEGKLALDDPIERHLPEFRGLVLAAGAGKGSAGVVRPPARQPTVRDLLRHTSGLPGGLPPDMADLYVKRDRTLAEAVAAIAKRPLEFEPGSRWAYCNAGIDTLGRIIEVVSGQPYEKFMAERIFTPLGMTDTTFYPDPPQRHRMATLYDCKDGKLVSAGFQLLGPTEHARYPIPAGGLYSCGGDLARLYQMMLCGGQGPGRRILSEKSVRAMTTLQTGELATGFVAGMGYGLGWAVVRQPQGITEMLSPGTFGHGGAFGTQGWIDPQQDLFMILLIQRVGLPNGDASDMRRELQRLAVASLAPAAEKPAAAAETKAQREGRMAWWRAARFGMFIHWGVYSVPAGSYQGKPIGGIGEWIMHNGKIPVAEYRKFAARFNPVRFDADAWVRTAKEAGMKYIVITSKHHDGFAMFDSKASDWCITKAAPFHRDPLAELAEACRRQGIKLGFYYSQAQDWNNPGGATYDGHWDKAQDGDMDKYLDTVAVPQVREILSNYGPVAVLWWDTPANMTRQRAEKFLPLLKLQPGLITNNRLGGGFAGDTETPEQFVPATGYPGRDWETCMTMNDTWGYKSDDHNWKSSEMLIRNLVDIASKGGNYLLNVGPTSEGLIPAPSVQRLKEVGQWMKLNGEAIYGTAASPFKKLPWGRATRKPGKLYLHVFDWPQGELQVPGLKNKVTRAYLLADAARSPLEVTTGEGGVRIKLPPKAPSPPVSVVVLEIEGEPEVAAQLLGQAADGSIALAAADAVVHGETAQYESGGGKDNIGFWTNAQDWVSWDFNVKQPGRFEVNVTYACEPGSFGSRYTAAVGPSAVHGEVKSTGDWAAFVSRKLGVLEIPAAGPVKLTVKPDSMPHGAVMNLKAVRLTPVKR